MRIACIDIGGTFIKSGIQEHGVLEQVRETPTNAAAGGAALLATVVELIRAMPGVQRVGICTAGEVDASTGRIRLSDNIPGYTGMNPKGVIEQVLGLPTTVENDVNAAAVGEYAFGAARGHKDFLMLSYGTGVGGAIVSDGALYRGSADSAGEFGGLLTHPEDVRTGDRGSGSYERYASTAALVARVSQQAPHLTSGRAIFAQLADDTVRRTVDAWVQEVAYGIVSLLHALNPSLLVLGGGIMREAYILNALRAVLDPMTKPSFLQYMLAPAQLGNGAGMMGAGYLAAQDQ